MPFALVPLFSEPPALPWPALLTSPLLKMPFSGLAGANPPVPVPFVVETPNECMLLDVEGWLKCAEVEAALEVLAAKVLGFTRIEELVADGVEHSSVSRETEVAGSPSSSKEVDGTFC